MENKNKAGNMDESLGTINFINAANARELIKAIVRIDNKTKEGQETESAEGKIPKRE